MKAKAAEVLAAGSYKGTIQDFQLFYWNGQYGPQYLLSIVYAIADTRSQINELLTIRINPDSELVISPKSNLYKRFKTLAPVKSVTEIEIDFYQGDTVLTSIDEIDSRVPELGSMDTLITAVVKVSGRILNGVEVDLVVVHDDKGFPKVAHATGR